MNQSGNDQNNEEVPYFQQLFDKPFHLLAAGMVVMVVFYTAWGLYEIMSMSTATLP